MTETAEITRDEPLSWVEACTLDVLQRRSVVGVLAGGEDLVLVHGDGAIFAAERKCPHESADLAKGRCSGGRLLCPRHLAWFDLATGEVPGWDVRPLRTYPTRISDGQVYVGLRLRPLAPKPPEPF